MAGRCLPGTDCRVRRARRDDLPQVESLLGAPAPAPRFWRRLLARLMADVYVAEDAAGTVVGLVAMSYTRLLSAGGAVAVLDTVRARGEGEEVVEGLVAFAESRARRRGCRQILAWPAPGDVGLRAALTARGYATGEAMVRALEAPR